jgi:N-acetylmuramoyl-L-alanine amidase
MNLHKQLLTKNECYSKGVSITPVGVMVHSTGANNPNLKRYVQPDDGLLGTNNAGNDFNQYRPGGRQVCVHAFIGKLADGTIATYQTLPWAMRGWHSGKGSKGSANNMGYIGFEICEDGLTDSVYFGKVYREAVELTAYLCKLYKLDPKKDGVIICHSEGYKRGIASNHGDVMHWFPKHGKNMDTFRADVAAEMNGTKSANDTEKGEDEDMDINKLLNEMTGEQAAALYAKAMTYISAQSEPTWSQTEGYWQKATLKGIVDGQAPERPVKRDELAAILGRGGLL